MVINRTSVWDSIMWSNIYGPMDKQRRFVGFLPSPAEVFVVFDSKIVVSIGCMRMNAIYADN